MSSLVSQIPAAAPDEASLYFSRRLRFETDCSDVYHSLLQGNTDFVLADARSTALYQLGHLPRAVSLPHATIDEGLYPRFARDTLFVVYCAGPHCNGAQRAALALSRLGYTVKEMIGGVTGWLDEGFTLEGVGRDNDSSGCGC